MIIGSVDLSRETLVIAEIGNNHEGDLGRAREMIQAAAATGVQAVKFQTIEPERLVSSEQSARIQQLRRFAFNREQFTELAVVARKAGVMFMSTPFSVGAVGWLDELVPAFKIASGDNNFERLLTAVGSTGKPVLISTGMADLAGIKKSCEIVEGAAPVQAGGIAVLHCVSAYPTPDDQANLLAIPELSRETGHVVGYSDHTLGIDAASIAVVLGARIIEKHFTLSKTQSDFRDHALSADPAEMAELVRRVRTARLMLGSGHKSPQPAEMANQAAARRSIATLVALPAGHMLTDNDLDWLRPGVGLAPGREGEVLGRRLTRDAAAGEVITPDMLA
jgi:N,N'-diacetyllegionaminate synthase